MTTLGFALLFHLHQFNQTESGRGIDIHGIPDDILIHQAADAAFR